MSDNGSFVVTWDAVVSQRNGIVLNTVVMARLFDANENPVTINGSNVEFQVDVGDNTFIHDPEHDTPLAAEPGTTTNPIPRTASNAQVSMDAAGDFIVTWEAYQDNDVVTANDTPDSYGIYYRRFNPDGTPVTAMDEQANLTITALGANGYSLQQAADFAGNQVNPSIAMDAEGDYAIVWDGQRRHG